MHYIIVAVKSKFLTGLHEILSWKERFNLRLFCALI